MLKPKAPCKHCSTRHENCHSKCEKYLEYKKAHSEEAKKIFEERMASRWKNGRVVFTDARYRAWKKELDRKKGQR